MTDTLPSSQCEPRVQNIQNIQKIQKTLLTIYSLSLYYTIDLQTYRVHGKDQELSAARKILRRFFREIRSVQSPSFQVDPRRQFVGSSFRLLVVLGRLIGTSLIYASTGGTSLFSNCFLYCQKRVLSTPLNPQVTGIDRRVKQKRSKG